MNEESYKDETNTTVADAEPINIVWTSTNYECPYRRPCGKVPCEMGEKCPFVDNKKNIIYVPYPYYPPYSPYTPGPTWYDSGGTVNGVYWDYSFNDWMHKTVDVTFKCRTKEPKKPQV